MINWPELVDELMTYSDEALIRLIKLGESHKAEHDIEAGYAYEVLAARKMRRRQGMKLSPCPFCGGGAEVEREGTNRQSCIVKCTNCGCRLESNEIGYGDRWNDRSDILDHYYDERIIALTKCLNAGHVSWETWYEARENENPGVTHPCDSWLAIDCETCRGACSCHWTNMVPNKI